ncbi:hypothetical protein ACP4OV_016750 [Aristida adscensionis]
MQLIFASTANGLGVFLQKVYDDVFQSQVTSIDHLDHRCI